MAERGFTQSRLAKAVGMSENSLSRKLSGEREFRLSEVISICQVLNIENATEFFLETKSQICNNKHYTQISASRKEVSANGKHSL